MGTLGREGQDQDAEGLPVRLAYEEGAFALTDGAVVSFRPVRPEDAPALRRFHRRLSERSVRLRFFGAKPELSARKAAYFTNVDGVNRFGLVVLDPERHEEIVAIASFYREGSTDRAEYAAAVEDGWQGRGLGLALTRRLIDAALRRGIRVFTGMVLPENDRMLNLLRDLRLPERLRYEDGVELVEIQLVVAEQDRGFREAGATRRKL
jgi:GNAT superfamily N-acetyltransferase